MSRIRNKDIAELVGVSRAAVTQVLNGSRPGCVSAEKRKAILRIASEHNSRPDFAAQVLGSGKTRTIGMPLPWMETLSSSLSYGRLLKHLTDQLEKKGYMLTLLPLANDSAEKIRESTDDLLRSRRVDGLIVNLPFLKVSPESRQETDRTPVVSISFSSDSAAPFPEISHVGFDCTQALEELIGRFSTFGKTAVIAAPNPKNARTKILRAHSELFFASLPASPYFLHNTAAEAMVFVRKNWQELKKFPCWILQNDNFLYGAACVIREMGLIPGKDILLAGFDDAEENFEKPFFTTVRDPFEQMAQTCIRLLFDKIEQKERKKTEHVMLSSTVIYRDSSLPANPEI